MVRRLEDVGDLGEWKVNDAMLYGELALVIKQACASLDFVVSEGSLVYMCIICVYMFV